MKIGAVYTGRSEQLSSDIKKELQRSIGAGFELDEYADPSILSEINEAKRMTPDAAARLARMYMDAIANGADAILNVCSSVGDVADSMQGFAELIDVPIVRIDALMAEKAVLSAKKIAVMATLPSTLEPTCSLITRSAENCGREVELTRILVNAFGMERDEFARLLTERAVSDSGDAELILLAQGSMAPAERAIAEATHLPVYSSPRFGAEAMRNALIAKGLILE